MIHYFAYGSNLHPVRLRERVPSASLVDVIELRRYRLAFQKRGHDGSGKCHLHSTVSDADSVFGAIYRISREHKTVLDRFEGKGDGYMDHNIVVQHQAKQYACFTYLAQDTHIVDHLKPYHWYKKLVVMGAEYLQFPDAYLASIEAVESIEDPEESRWKKIAILIDKMANYR